MTKLVWYFDFISPFAYLQWQRFGELPDGAPVEVRPVLFAGLLKHWEHRGPAEIPAKRTFTYRHVQWYAERHGVALRMPPAHPFNPLPPLRLALALDARHEAVNAIFDYIWRRGGDVADAARWEAFARSLGVADVAAATGAQAVKDGLRANTDAALAAGVFGVPTFLAGDALFWGLDATEMLLDYLADPARFERGELARVARLPAAVHRRQTA